MDKKPEKLVPEVRFKGFTDDWEQRKLNSIAHQTFGGGTPSKSNKQFWNGDFPWIQSSDLAEDTIRGVHPNKFITQNALLISAAKKIPKNSIAIVSRVGVGKVALIPFNYSTSQDFLSLSSLKINSQFATYSIHKIMKKTASQLQGTSIKGITKKDILNKTIIFPISEKEQVHISSLLKYVDYIISLQQRKLKQLNLLQRYIKEKTLPSQKELPKLRFLTTPYNTYKFSELFKKSTKKNDEQILQNHVISVASMRWGKLPKSSSEAYMKTYFIFNKGDIAYEGNRSKSYSFGRFVANDLGNGIVSHVFSVFNSKINFNLEFLKNYINSEQVMRDPLRMSTSRTTMMTNLVLKDIAKQTLMIPSKDEQDLLGSLYKITQSMIELNEKQQQELIYLKKYLLQKLFI